MKKTAMYSHYNHVTTTHIKNYNKYCTNFIITYTILTSEKDKLNPKTLNQLILVLKTTRL